MNKKSDTSGQSGFKARSDHRIDPELFAEIWQIPAIDNHAHPQASLDPEGRPDEAYICLACGQSEFRPTPAPTMLRWDNPIIRTAWKTFFDIDVVGELSERQLGELIEARTRIAAEHGEHYPGWVLRKMHIKLMLANRIEIAEGLKGEDFRWVSYGDALTLPFPTSALQINPDRKIYHSQQEGFFRRELERAGLTELPATFDEYLTKVVTPCLERHRAEGAVALKFVSAYLRALDFELVTREDAAYIYDIYCKGGAPSAIEYKILQDFVARYAVREAGRLGLSVHFHTGGGCGQYFYVGGGNPLLLESLINDPNLRDTNVVLIHGAYPWLGEAATLTMKPNIYVDFSAQPFLFTADLLSETLRRWLEFIPEKLLYGTDAVPIMPGIGWEETAWLANHNAREALAIALTGMIRDGEISRDRASELARLALHDNAARLYGLPTLTQ